MSDPFLVSDLGNSQLRRSHDADQAEWQALKFGSANINYGLRDEALSGEYELGSDELQRAEESLADEIERRIKLFGKCYPFKREKSSLKYVQSKTSAYEFCLSISTLSSISTADGKKFQIAFERLIRDVLKAFLGPGASSFRTGVPGDGLETRPNGIAKVSKLLNAQIGTGEFTWNPRNDIAQASGRRQNGDLGMDVVAWKQFPDNRRGNLMLVGQCACGKTDWQTKFSEPDKTRLDRWFRPLTYVPFVKCFAVPFHIPNHVHFGDVSESAGLTLDRGRIAVICENKVNQKFIRESAPVKYTDLVELAKKRV